MHRFSLFDLLDQEMTRERLPSFRSPHLYPSEASVRDADGVLHGSCLRSVFYRLTKTPKTNPPNARAQWIFDLGLAVEETIIRRSKEAGIWFDDHIKWYNPDYHVSGEVDLIIRNPLEPDMLIGVEIKSFYGYMATAEIMGTRTKPGFPKISQLLQTFLYTDWFKEILSGFKMAYLARDATENRRDFNIEFHETNGATGQDEVLVYPVVDGKIYPKFTLNGIYERFTEAWNYFTARQLPPRDFQLYYSKEEMEQRVKDGLTSKVDAAGFKKKPSCMKYRKADWQCRYCDYRNLCWEFTRLSNEEIQDLTGEEVQEAA